MGASNKHKERESLNQTPITYYTTVFGCWSHLFPVKEMWQWKTYEWVDFFSSQLAVEAYEEPVSVTSCNCINWPLTDEADDVIFQLYH